MQTNDVKSTFSPEMFFNKEYQVLFDELCYETFYRTQSGQKLLALMENKHFRSPVAYPNREPSWAYFHEGMNEMIRSFSAGMQRHLIQSQKKKEPVKPRSKTSAKP